jgi:hypothetical protein
LGSRQASILTWLTGAGHHAQSLHHRFFAQLRLPHLQLDERGTRLRGAREGLWLAIDALTTRWPVLQLGPTTPPLAPTRIHSLPELLAAGGLPLLTSEGLHVSLYALTAHSGQWLALGRPGWNVRRWQVEPGLI